LYAFESGVVGLGQRVERFQRTEPEKSKVKRPRCETDTWGTQRPEGSKEKRDSSLLRPTLSQE